MKFKVGDIIYSDYYDKWGFVSKFEGMRTMNQTKRIGIMWFDGTGEQYTIGSYAYSSLKKVEDI